MYWTPARCLSPGDKREEMRSPAERIPVRAGRRQRGLFRPPEFLDRVFGVETLRARLALRIDPVPARRIGLAGREDAATRQLQVAIGPDSFTHFQA